ncbi:LCP family protein [Citricoccus sp. GCM10030269]|uniref:LCP family protein n=1 Tax=Citricoccus sp. GCM10030269 TaxID=3273388 RepID=UPI003616F4E7
MSEPSPHSLGSTGEGGTGDRRNRRRGPDGQNGKTRPQRKNRAVWVVLGVALVLVIGAAIVAVGYLANLASTFDNSPRFETAFPEAESRPTKAPAEEGREEPLNILLLGSDSGGGSGETENLPGVPQSGRSDTMMWVHIPGDREKVYVMSVMRDLWVDIPGEGTHKLNAAYSFGGVPKAVQTLESLFGTRIDHVAAIDLAGFEGLVDSLGGVDVNVPESFQAGNGGKSFHAGMQHMDGDTGLAFVRERYAFSDGDYSRVEHQQLFLKAVAQKVLAGETLTNPGKVSDMVSELSPYLTVDETLNSGKLVSIGRTMTHIRADDLEMFTVPTNGVGRAGGQSVVWPDEQAIEEIGSALSNDDLSSYLSGR